VRKVFAVMLITVGIVFIAYNIWGQRASGGEQKTANERYTFAASSVNDIVINSSSVNVKVVKGETSEDVVVQLTGNPSERSNFTADLSDGELNVKYKAKWKLFSFDFNFTKKTEIIVEVPDKQWENFNVKLSSGNTIIKQLNAKTASIEASSGNIVVEQFKVDQLTTKISSGNTTLRQGTGSVDSRGSSGNIKVELSSIDGDVKLKSSSGNIELTTMQEPANVAIELSTSSGRISTDWSGLDFSGRDKKTYFGRIGSGDLKVELSTSSGNVKLLKS